MNINYLRGEALNKIQAVCPELERNRGLNVLAKSLGYKSFRQIHHEYKINDKTGEILLDLVENDSYSEDRCLFLFNGFLFNEFALQEYLKIPLNRAKLLKVQLDKDIRKVPHDNYDGNIGTFTNTRLRGGINEMMKGNQYRVMCHQPLRFYCNREKIGKITFKDKKENLSIDSFMFFDGFGFNCSARYFKGNSMSQYLSDCLDIFLEYDNILFKGTMHMCDDLKIALEQFEHYYCDAEYEKSLKRSGCIFIPQQTKQG